MTPSNIFLAGAAIVTLGIVSINGVNILHEPQNPIKVLSAVTITKEVKVDGVLHYSLTVDKTQDCGAEYDMHFVSDAGDLKTAGTSKGGRFPLGRSTRRMSVKLPSSVSPGEWVLDIIGRAGPCPGEHWVWHVKNPPIKFTVVE